MEFYMVSLRFVMTNTYCGHANYKMDIGSILTPKYFMVGN
jgi:hypothetical protein